MKIWTCGSSPWSGSRINWTRIKNVSGASCLSNFWNFLGMIQMISCRNWWPWTKPGYITMTRRQSNNQWFSGIAAHPAPKNSKCKNLLEKFSPWVLGSMRSISGHLQPRRNWPTWASDVLISTLFSGSGPFRLPRVPGNEKDNWKVTIFPPARSSLLPQRPGWMDNLLNFFWVACKS